MKHYGHGMTVSNRKRAGTRRNKRLKTYRTVRSDLHTVSAYQSCDGATWRPLSSIYNRVRLSYNTQELRLPPDHVNHLHIHHRNPLMHFQEGRAYRVEGRLTLR